MAAPAPITLQPRLLSLDWLTVNMGEPEISEKATSLPWHSMEPCTWTGRDVLLSNVYTVMPQDIRTSQFGHIAYVMDHNRDKVATISHTPHQVTRGSQWMQVQFANRTLYTGEWAEIFRMLRALRCEYRSVSRIDIAADALQSDGGNYTGVIARTSTDAKYYGHSEWLQRSARSKVIGAEFGSRASNKHIRVYNKTREMRAKGEKPHVIAAWIDAFGEDVYGENKNVQRLEIALKGKEIRRHFPEERNETYLLALAETGPRVDLFASMVPKMFDFRTVAERARDAEPVARWCWSCVHAGAPDIRARAQRNPAISIHGQKVAIRSLYILATTTGDRHLEDLAHHYALSGGNDLFQWYQRSILKWLKEASAYERSKDVRTKEIISHMTNWTAPIRNPFAIGKPEE